MTQSIQRQIKNNIGDEARDCIHSLYPQRELNFSSNQSDSFCAHVLTDISERKYEITPVIFLLELLDRADDYGSKKRKIALETKYPVVQSSNKWNQ